MSERKWTKGPWHASEVASIWNSDESDEIADVWDHGRGMEETQANAQLIAAAPDLYEALEQARDTILELINARNSEAEGSDEDWVGGINAALSKARGETQ